MQKKGLSAFIKKQQTKKEKKSGEAATQGEVQKAQDIEVEAKKDQVSKNTTSGAGKKEESSDEEEDELDVAKKQINYKKIVGKDISVANAHAGDKNKKEGYGLDEENTQEDAKVEVKEKKEKTGRSFGGGGGGGNIVFGNKPSFGNRNKGTFKAANNDFAAGLDDLDEDEGAAKKKGGKGFITRETGHQQQAEEEKDFKKPTGIKPTFRGRMNVRGTAGDEESSGVKQD